MFDLDPVARLRGVLRARAAGGDAWVLRELALGDEDGRVRAAATARLADAVEPEVAWWLRDALWDALPSVREAAWTALAQHALPGVLEHAAVTLTLEPSWWVRRACVWTVTGLAGAAPVIALALDDPQWRVRHAATRALTPHPDLVRELAETSPSEVVREACRFVLGHEPGDARARPLPVDDDPAVAAERLERDVTTLSRSALVALLGDPHESLRAAAEVKLAALPPEATARALLPWLDEPRAEDAFAATHRLLSTLAFDAAALARERFAHSRGRGQLLWAATTLIDAGLHDVVRAALSSPHEAKRGAAFLALAGVEAVPPVALSLVDRYLAGKLVPGLDGGLVALRPAPPPRTFTFDLEGAPAALRRGDPLERRAAAAFLVEHRAQLSAEVAARLADELAGDPEPDLRALAVPLARAELGLLLRLNLDVDPGVRSLAASALEATPHLAKRLEALVASSPVTGTSAPREAHVAPPVRSVEETHAPHEALVASSPVTGTSAPREAHVAPPVRSVAETHAPHEALVALPVTGTSAPREAHVAPPVRSVEETHAPHEAHVAPPVRSVEETHAPHEALVAPPVRSVEETHASREAHVASGDHTRHEALIATPLTVTPAQRVASLLAAPGVRELSAAWQWLARLSTTPLALLATAQADDVRLAEHLASLTVAFGGESAVAPPVARAPPTSARVSPSPHQSWRALGTTGLEVSPLVLSGANELDVAGFTEAADRGLNTFFWEPGATSTTRFLRQATDACRVVTGSYHSGAAALRRDVETALRRLGRERLDVFLLFWVRSRGRLSTENLDALEQLRAEGLIATFGFSTHLRDVALEALPRWPVVMTRLSLAHPGAEVELLPAARAAGTGVFTFTSTCYGRLLRDTPHTVRASAQECYQFALERPGVSAAVIAPRNVVELDAALSVLDAPPLLAAREDALRAHGRAVRESSRAINHFIRQVPSTGRAVFDGTPED